jgi:purine-nucleoside phosphorylase
LHIPVHVGNVFSSDVFYSAKRRSLETVGEMGVLAVEMEAAALYMNAARLGKKALCILTVSDHFVHDEVTTSEEREKTFTDMMKIALDWLKN